VKKHKSVILRIIPDFGKQLFIEEKRLKTLFQTFAENFSKHRQQNKHVTINQWFLNLLKVLNHASFPRAFTEPFTIEKNKI